jgi:hypothetical protein
VADTPDLVHVFISTGRFRSIEEMRGYVDEAYTEDGDGIPSTFMLEVDLTDYEPNCIETIVSKSAMPVPLSELMATLSYAEQWLPNLDGTREADAAICVFAPNCVEQPNRCSLEYLGAFGYRVVHPEWFQKILRDMAQPKDEPQ